ncbi:MAG: hypothetical protein ACJ764_13475 [Solirubrobacteraceae bacterium]
MRGRLALGLLAIAILSVPSWAGAKVFRVGTYHGIKGQFKSVQAAVNAAKPGDWILIGPGDYKTHSISMPTTGHPADNFPAGVLITTPRLRIRGMNRNKVIVDGTKSGPPCSKAQGDQNFGKSSSDGPSGLNGLLVWEADNVSIQNLTACNFLAGTGAAGNEIWWNGGADGGGTTKVGIHGWGFLGSYLNATSTFYKDEHSAAQYGIFSSNWNGGTWDHTYASNFNDSGYYIGACGKQCNQTVNHAWAEFSALGYSGSNSGGLLIVKNSEFDHNQDGFDTNSQNGDNPPPQDGSCPHGMKPPVKGAVGCWVFMHNFVHDNNNPNVPAAGSAAAGPVGTGLSVAGGRNDTIIDNRFVNNKAWGVILVPYPDSGGPCTGGTPDSPVLGPGSCLYDEWGDALIRNKFTNNGGYGNPTNGDFDQLNFESHPSDCYRGNTDSSGHLSPDSQKLQQKYPHCTKGDVPPNPNVPFLNEVLCDSQTPVPPFGCQSGDHYPRQTKVVMHPLPTRRLSTMPHPCKGVPANPWCPSQHARDRNFTG